MGFSYYFAWGVIGIFVAIGVGIFVLQIRNIIKGVDDNGWGF